MTLGPKGEVIEQLADELARRIGTTRSDAMVMALEHELERTFSKAAFEARLQALQNRVAARLTGVEIDKSFFDGLSGGL